MSAPRRLLEDGASGFERRLLRAASTDRPARQARARLLVSLGVVAAATTAEGAGAAGAMAAGTKAWVLKSLGVAVLVTATGAAAVHVVRSPVSPRPESGSTTITAGAAPTPAQQPEASRVASPAPPRAVEPTAPSPPSTAAFRPSVVAAPRSSPPAVNAAPPPLPQAPSLGEETASLDAARTALRAHRPSEAIALLDVYARRVPGGVLQPEASALRVEALLAAGDRAGAEAVARALVAAQPRSPAAHRARAMLNW